MTRYRWVAARKAEGFPITIACKVAQVSRQAFSDWRARQAAGPSPAALAEAALVAEIRQVHDEFDRIYGEPRVTAELARRGRRVNHKRVERLMRAHGIVGVHKPAKVRTTIPAEGAPPLPDLIGRRFDPGAPDVAWVGDITYVPTGEGWLYLASVLDLGSRRLLGYSMADHMRTELVTNALTMAAGARGGVTTGIIFHGDRGSQYLSGATGNSSLISPWSSRSAGPGCAGTTRWPSRSGHRSNASWCTATGSVTGPAPGGRSSPGSTPTTTSDSTRASATAHPPSGRTTTVNPRSTRPRNQRDRSAGGPSVCGSWVICGGAPFTCSGLLVRRRGGGRRVPTSG